MDEIEKRLRECSERCLATFSAWRGDQKNATAREELQEAVHELRKVASRLDIELAISERDQQGKNSMAIPPHRDAQNRSQDYDDGMPDFNTSDNENNGNRMQQQQQPRRPMHQPRRDGGGGGQRRMHGGGGGGGGGSNRRPSRDE